VIAVEGGAASQEKGSARRAGFFVRGERKGERIESRGEDESGGRRAGKKKRAQQTAEIETHSARAIAVS